jgi:hypothetical protein
MFSVSYPASGSYDSGYYPACTMIFALYLNKATYITTDDIIAIASYGAPYGGLPGGKSCDPNIGAVVWGVNNICDINHLCSTSIWNGLLDGSMSSTEGGPWSFSSIVSNVFVQGAGPSPYHSSITFSAQLFDISKSVPSSIHYVGSAQNIGSVGYFVVDPVCSATHYNCVAGVSSHPVDGPSSYTWSCEGEHPSGSTGTVSCSETKTTNLAPDLTAGAITPTTADVGKATTFSATVSNIGAKPTGPNFTNLFQTATKADYSDATDRYTTVRQSALPAGGSFVTSFSYTFPAVSTYYIRLCADKNSASDVNGVIVEPQLSPNGEFNNCGAWTPIVVSSPISATCSVSPSSGWIGDTFTWTASNATGGTGPYTYTWNGTDGLSGTGTSVTKQPSYTTTGTKTGSVTVTASVGGSKTIDCTNSVLVNHCYGQGCGIGGGCDYPSPPLPAQPRTTIPLQCCSPNPNVCPVPPVVTLTAAPNPIERGQTTVLTWKSTSYPDADYCVWDGYFAPLRDNRGGPGPFSTTTLRLLTSQDFGIRCHNSGGTSTPVTVDVTVQQPEAHITANPVRVPAGQSSTITWDANIIKSCKVTGPSNTVLASGSAKNGKFDENGKQGRSNSSDEVINTQSVYTITCDTNYDVPVTASVIVNILPLFQEF